MGWLVWLGAALVLGIVEVMTVDLVFLMLALGALSGAGASAAGVGLPGQLAVFAGVSLVLLFLVRPALKSRLRASSPEVRTNAQGLVGEVGTVVETVRAGSDSGRVRLEGGVWSARPADAAGGELGVGERVLVTAIDGATAVVRAAGGMSRPAGAAGSADEPGPASALGTDASAHATPEGEAAGGTAPQTDTGFTEKE